MKLKAIGLFLFLSMFACPSQCACGEGTGSRSLVEAAENRQWEQVAQLLKSGADPNQHQPDGMTATHWAAFHDRPSLIKQLADAGAETNPANDYGIIPLALACRFGHEQAAKQLLDLGADANAETAGGETMLMHAARSGNARLVELLLKHHADPNQRQREDQTALMCAAAEGHAEVVDRLLEHGADWEAKLDSGFTAMHLAARNGHGAAVRRLLKAGADINARINPDRTGGRAPRKGMSALMLAVESGHFELALQLVELGADPNDQRSGYAPLHAVSWVRKPPRGDNAAGDPPPQGSGDVGSLQFVRELVARGADVNLRLDRGRYSKARLNHNGATPMLLAAHTNDVPLMRVLHELGADLAIANADETTPILAAAGVGIFVADEYPGTEPEAIQSVNQLVDWGASVHDVDKHGETVIHGAAYRSFAKLVDRLVELGAKPGDWNQKNSIGSTPRQIAQGKRPGSFKPNRATIAAIDRALKAAGIAR